MSPFEHGEVFVLDDGGEVGCIGKGSEGRPRGGGGGGTGAVSTTCLFSLRLAGHQKLYTVAKLSHEARFQEGEEEVANGGAGSEQRGIHVLSCLVGQWSKARRPSARERKGVILLMHSFGNWPYPPLPHMWEAHGGRKV
eukprot:364201-Chlamydomonas_euryale.AAC.26